MNQDHRQAIARTVTGFFQELGAQLEEYSEGRAVVGLTLTEKHMNNASSLHGGVTASLLDIAMGLCGTWAASPEERRVAITLSLINFLVLQFGGVIKQETKAVSQKHSDDEAGKPARSLNESD